MDLPKGYRFAGVHCGLKRNPNKPDIGLIVADQNVTAAGVYTQNKIFAAPVKLDRERTPSDRIRAIVINSGNANACTGDRGWEDAKQMARYTAEQIGVNEEQVLVLSTGIIGEFLPMEKIQAGIEQAAAKLSADEESLALAARGFMTTDTYHKIKTTTVELSTGTFQIVGICKGAAMIGPKMATMLAVLITDAPLTAIQSQELLTHATNQSFNCLSVEGHMSTNDTVLLMAESSGERLSSADQTAFSDALNQVCVDLAKEIANDGEGNTHVIQLDVTGCATREDAHKIAKTVANSALVKTAIAGADPNWGRIVSAAGYAEVSFDPQGVSLSIQGHSLYENGLPITFDEATVSAAIKESRDTSMVLSFSEGDASVRFWTTDLTTEYVRLNADYHT